MWQTLSQEEKNMLLAKCMVLFPETINPVSSRDKYSRAVLWLCSYAQVVSSCFRDDFSAGGTVSFLNGKPLGFQLPRVFETILRLSPQIKSILQSPDSEMIELILQFNPALLPNPLKKWIEICESIGCKYNIPLADWILNDCQLS